MEERCSGVRREKVVRRGVSGGALRLLVCLALVFVVGVVSVRSARSSGPTYVSGSISSNTTWTAANSPYVLSGTVSVSTGVTLTIDPGVWVEGSSQSVGLSVHGSLSAVGTTSAPIVFTSVSDTAPAQWGGVSFESGSGTSTLQHVVVRYGGGGGASDQNGMVNVVGGTVSVVDSTVRDSSVSGMSIDGGGDGHAATVTITRSKFLHNGYAGTTRQGHGLFTNQASVTIRDSAFWQNAKDGIKFQVGSGFTAAQSTMAGTSVWGNHDGGVYIADSFAQTLGLVGHVAGELPNEIYDNGSFGYSQSESWSQLGLSNSSTSLDWRDVYWGPVVYQSCSFDDQYGRQRLQRREQHDRL